MPVPGRVLREQVDLTNDARRDIPSTIIATGYSAEDYQTYAREHREWSFLAGIPELRKITWVDLPTSHWPMWSKPDELAGINGRIAREGPGRPRRRRRALATLLGRAAFGHYAITATATGKPFESDWAHVVTIVDGKVVQFQEFTDSVAFYSALTAALRHKRVRS